MTQQKFIPKMTGYKATNALMQCQPDRNKEPFQFEIGKWYEAEGEIEICKNGFHFCDQQSGVWAFYSMPDARVFKVEAENVLDLPIKPGAGHKWVASRIRLVEEVRVTGDYNTGYSNTGDYNTGDSNTGNRNTGDYNTGSRNTGDYNTGYYNTGSRNTGYYNTGYYNTGDSNTGSRNTGYYNTGYYNTGSRNTGDSNTGDGNATNYSSGFFCVVEPKVVSFDVQTEFTRDQFMGKFPEVERLAWLLIEAEPISFDEFASIPGITPEKLDALHKAHLEGRK